MPVYANLLAVKPFCQQYIWLSHYMIIWNYSKWQIAHLRVPLPVIIFCSPMPVTILLRQMRSKAPEVTGCMLQPSNEWPGLTKHLYFKKYLEFLQINLFFSFWSCSQFENRSRTNQTITKSNEHVPNPDWFALPWSSIHFCGSILSNYIHTHTVLLLKFRHSS